jgi:hypothetical protein
MTAALRRGTAAPAAPAAPARREAGTALLGLMIGVAATAAGQMLAMQAHATTMQRERETDLLFIGEEFVRAIRAYHVAGPPTARLLPASLEDLLIDRRSGPTRTHLRRLYADPFTGRPDWGLIRLGDRIIGVHSRAKVEPMKRTGFPASLAGFERAKTVADWRFIYVPMSATTTQRTTAQSPGIQAARPGAPQPQRPAGR